MPTPVGHALGGLAAYLAAPPGKRAHKDWTLLGGTLLAALLPDLDLAIGPLAGRSYHHYFTHSLGFSVLVAGIAFWAMRRMGRASAGRDALVIASGYLSHIFLDMLTKDTTPPFGVQLFWPLADAFLISPVTVFSDVWRGSLAVTFGLHNWLAMGRELLVLVPVVGLFWWLHGRRGQLE
ncbi:MAG: metal-dependent hydrolase [Vicinamibacteria bacterium]